MPYINKKDRPCIDGLVLALNHEITSPKELNYTITRLILARLHEPGSPGLAYTKLALVLGTLEAVKMELYRRVIAPYEETKRWENGDVFCKEERRTTNA